MIQWDSKNQVLTDSMGYPLSRADALAIRDRARRHLRKSPADLAALAREIMEEKSPGMVAQTNLEPERFK